MMRLTIDELLILAPRLRTYLTMPRPDWRDIVNAANWLRCEMGICRPLWGETCVAMGRECAAVAVARFRPGRQNISAPARAGVYTAKWPRRKSGNPTWCGPSGGCAGAGPLRRVRQG